MGHPVQINIIEFESDFVATFPPPWTFLTPLPIKGGGVTCQQPGILIYVKPKKTKESLKNLPISTCKL